MTGQGESETQIWVIEPTWQNFSSMYREAICAQEASSGMEISHHRMAALYFGISTIECLLNQEMTKYQLSQGMEHDEIHKLLMKPLKFNKKISDWPKIIYGQKLTLRPGSIETLHSFNGLRGNLTHVKNFWPDTFEDLGRRDPMQLVELVAEYIIALYMAKGESFPSWVWGWNYLSPNRDGYQISLLTYGQFFHSLRSLGFKFEQPASYGSTETEQEILSDFDGYQRVAAFLRSCDRCEPKWDVAPHQPKLCRRWWEPMHQTSCGAVTPEAFARAVELDEERARRMTKPKERPTVNDTIEVSSWRQGAALWVLGWFKS